MSIDLLGIVWTDREAANLHLSAPVSLAEHPATVYLRSLSTGSQRTMKQSLNSIASLLTNGKCDYLTLDWSKLRYKHTSTIRNYLKEFLAPPTVNKMLAALRRVLTEAYRLDLIGTHDYLKAKDIKDVALEPTRKGRAIALEELELLLEAAKNCPRDLALLGLLRMGLRRAEICSLKLGDLVRNKLTVLGKRKKTRYLELPPKILSLLQDWLEIRGNGAGALIAPLLKNGAVKYGDDGSISHLNPNSIYKIVAKLYRGAGLPPLSPHDFRRTFCTQLLGETDVLTVQQLAGHASAQTTSKYDKRGEAERIRAGRTIDF
jgi:integrase/recombinase XerD